MAKSRLQGIETLAREEQQKPKAIDLFSGCGGLTLGLKRAGFAVIGAVEICELAVKTYRMNHPEVAVWHDDIRSLPVGRMKRTLGIRKHELDLLAGCPPCQGFSTIRTRNGKRRPRDSRNDLLFEFLRFVEGLQPKAVMFENVPGLRRTTRMKEFCKRLRHLGYDITCDILDAADYGVPQRRRRLILLAGRNGGISFAPRFEQRRTVREAIGGLKSAGRSGDRLHDIPENRTAQVRELIKQVPTNGGSRADLGRRYQLQCHTDFSGFKDVYGRMAWDDVAPTITSGCVNPSKGRFLHPQSNRCITLREAAILQDFPRKYRFSLDRGKFPVAEMIGNALPPRFVRQHARSVLRYLSAEYT